MAHHFKKHRTNGSELHTAKDDDVPSDALVVFGVSGDLAYKMIFPALYAMAKRGALSVPVVGVAYSHWSVDQLRQRAKESILAGINSIDPMPGDAATG